MSDVTAAIADSIDHLVQGNEQLSPASLTLVYSQAEIGLRARSESGNGD